MASSGRRRALSKTIRSLLLFAGIAVMLGVVAGCGSGSSQPTGKASTAGAKKRFRVAMVADVGGLDDRSFNAAAYAGIVRAQKELDVETRVFTSASNIDYVPNLAAAARQGHDLVIPVGFMMSEATGKVAKHFPNTQFAIIDQRREDVPGKPKNVTGIGFKRTDSGYLAGTLAALYVKKNRLKPVISAVGALEIPPVNTYIEGYTNGAKAVDPKIKVLVGHSQDFTDQAKCKEIALSHIQHNAQVVFQVAGKCGFGALDAARKKNVQGIGVDTDQSHLGSHVISSAMIRVDTAVVEATKAFMKDPKRGKPDFLFETKNQGIGLGKLSPRGQEFGKKLKKVEAKLAIGKIRSSNT
jgi:basic membrane protein A